ncbi:mycofactocin system transcriptional regulator [Pseudonocardia asaccharolytica]|uniref:Putative transcriptional regulatory protein TetR n=1 Tax=Pseudonocardia asaccharolytica DSM 44247 = NBRC 16224 TaxID=1123024 RepID=A0A511D4V1_9PSEU|nr:mycofactocin system transcriptional regulator [Pseudonocardia asaccharolytica]GEL17958.1 putative transcriptional regulatory protein TetR [Pseudonocardia asaccharolytica DSM 44247 = NBRC 16224]
MSTVADEGARRAGRRPVTSRAEIEHIALDLFTERGFDTTTVDDIAHAAGIGRRTFFRYYASKNDVPWGAFDEQLHRMRATFAALPPDIPVMAGIRAAVLDFNEVAPAEQPWHRRRLRLILGTPALQAHSTLRYAAWRQVVADYAAERLGQPSDALIPQTIGHASLGVALAAYERWLAAEGSDLRALLDEVFCSLEHGLIGAGTDGDSCR